MPHCAWGSARLEEHIVLCPAPPILLHILCWTSPSSSLISLGSSCSLAVPYCKVYITSLITSAVVWLEKPCVCVRQEAFLLHSHICHPVIKSLNISFRFSLIAWQDFLLHPLCPPFSLCAMDWFILAKVKELTTLPASSWKLPSCYSVSMPAG